MKTVKLLTVLSMLLFIMSSCKENAEEIPDKYAMPPPTNHGANTLGCYINGQPFVADLKYDAFWGGGIRTSPHLTFNKGNVIYISASDNDMNESYISLKFVFDENPGIFELPKNTDYGNSEFIDFYYLGGKQYRMIMDEPHWVEVSAYKDNEYISGTFSFTGVNSDAGDTVRVTDGRFDIAFE